MHYKKESDFAKAVKSQRLSGPILLYGSESYLISRWKKELLARFGSEESFNLQKLDGRRLDLDTLYDATQMLPLMADEKCVLLDDLDLAQLPADEIKKLTLVLQELPPECMLLITAYPSGFDPKTAAAKKVIALADKHGSAVELSARDKPALVRFLQNTAQENGCAISPALCRTMLDICDNSMLVLRGEMQKLCAYAGGAEIRPEHLDAVLTARTEARVFDLGKAILAHNGQRAMEILNDLFYLREKPVAILATLILSFVDLYRARTAQREGVPQQELIERLGYRGREFRVRNAFRTPYSAATLHRCLEILYACDLRMKSSGQNDQYLLEQAVAELLCETAA
jgi:DNA polymerase III, delta subunit